MKLEIIVSVYLIIFLFILCLLCWTLMHLKNQYRIKHFTLQIGRRAQLAMEFDRFPADCCSIPESQLPSCGKGKKYAQKQTYHFANSRLFYAYIYSYHFIFCANEGRPKKKKKNLKYLIHCCCSHSCPSSSGICCKNFVSSRWTAAGPSLLVQSVQVLMTSSRGRVGSWLSGGRFPQVRVASWWVRKSDRRLRTFHTFIFGSLQF